MNKKEKKFYESGIRVMSLEEAAEFLARPGIIEDLVKQMEAAEEAKKERS